MVAVFNGPSPSWIKQWKWYGNQPSYRARFPQAPKPAVEDVRRSKRAKLVMRLKRALRDPRRFITGLTWQLRKPLTRVSLALNRPVPEDYREEYFMDIHASAERAYQPAPFDGDVLVFYGGDLYEDPTLGWDTSATKIASFGVPGTHENNRNALMEPGVGYVAEHLDAFLKTTADGSATAADEVNA